MYNSKKPHTNLSYDPKNIPHAKRMRRSMTLAERKLWYDFLHDFKYRFYRQRPILHYIADFYCTELKLVIELDGGGHFSENSVEYDSDRTKAFENIGLMVLRFTNDDVLQNFNGVCERIIMLSHS